MNGSAGQANLENLKRFIAGRRFFLVLCLAILLGLGGGLVTLVFIFLLRSFEQLLWQTLPAQLRVSNIGLYTIVVCVTGGVFVGLCDKYFGNWPRSMEESFTAFKTDGKFDYKHLPQSVLASFASLGFGASLGPEAALVTVVGGISSWISQKIKLTALNARALAYMGSTSALGALFGSPPGVAALSYSEEFSDRKRHFIWITLPGILAGLAGWWLYRNFSSGGYFSYNFLAYKFQMYDLVYFALPAIAAAIFGLAFIGLEKALGKILRPFEKHQIVLAMAGGLGLGILALGSSLILFSGHEGIQDILSNNSSYTGVSLALLSFGKILAATLLLAAGWKGGKFFPVMFIGAAIGLATSHVFRSVTPMVGVSSGMSAALAVLLRRPFVTILIMIFLFPPNLYLFAALSSLVGFGICKAVSTRWKLFTTSPI
ncbi:chloride channel protein [Candidatus Saccharibacteria bacterium]|nr:chloride channel protein [Candidatus Saccharibacteria bacterium]